METTIDQTTPDIDIACSLSATERVERGEQFAQLLAEAEDVAELKDGYALRFPNRDALVERAVELVIAERKCCPFFSFTLAFEPDNGPVWLQISGLGEVKTMIGAQLVPAHLLRRLPGKR